MAGGRPRDVSLPPEQMIELGKEMIDWVIENDPIHLSQWYSAVKKLTYNQWKTMQVCPEFFPYYEQALNLVGLKYIKKDSPIDNSLKQRWQRVYFKDLKHQEDEDAREELEREKELEDHKAKLKASQATQENISLADLKREIIREMIQDA